MRRINVAVIDSSARRRTRLVRLLSQQPDVAITGALDHALRTHRSDPGCAPPDVLLINLDHDATAAPRFWCLLRLISPRASIVGLTNSAHRPALENALAAGLIGLHPANVGYRSLLRAIRHAARGESDCDAFLLQCVKPLLSQPPLEVQAQAGRLPLDIPARTEAAVQVCAGLTGRELEALALLGQGLRNRQIADRLCLSEKTIRNRVGGILGKLRLANRTQAALWAAAHGLTVRENGRGARTRL